MAPELELFDLDDEFSTEHVKLAELTNKYTGSSTDDDLENYIKQAGSLLRLNKNQNLNPNDPGKKMTAKAVLAEAFKMICQLKMSDPGVVLA